MFKRPSQRVRCPPPIRGDKPKEGAFLYDIILSKPTDKFTFHKRAIYKEEDYLKALKNNHQNLGIPYEEPILPKVPPPLIYKPSNEPEIKFGDTIQVILNILKNGTIRVKVNGAIATMYEKYYHHGKEAPIKTILQAYKAHGFSKEFLEKIKRNHNNKLVYAKKVPSILQKIFDKEPVKKPKKVKVVIEEVLEEPDVVEEEEEEQIPPDEGELDVEPEEDEIVEEEYVSDGDE